MLRMRNVVGDALQVPGALPFVGNKPLQFLFGRHRGIQGCGDPGLNDASVKPSLFVPSTAIVSFTE